jgi:hypothetical protein
MSTVLVFVGFISTIVSAIVVVLNCRVVSRSSFLCACIGAFTVQYYGYKYELFRVGVPLERFCGRLIVSLVRGTERVCFLVFASLQSTLLP